MNTITENGQRQKSVSEILSAVPVSQRRHMFAEFERAINQQDIQSLGAAIERWTSLRGDLGAETNPLAEVIGIHADSPVWEEIQAQIERSNRELNEPKIPAEYCGGRIGVRSRYQHTLPFLGK